MPAVLLGNVPCNSCPSLRTSLHASSPAGINTSGGTCPHKSAFLLGAPKKGGESGNRILPLFTSWLWYCFLLLVPGTLQLLIFLKNSPPLAGGVGGGGSYNLLI
jgi:hypothetical protein